MFSGVSSPWCSGWWTAWWCESTRPWLALRGLLAASNRWRSCHRLQVKSLRWGALRSCYCCAFTPRVAKAIKSPGIIHLLLTRAHKWQKQWATKLGRLEQLQNCSTLCEPAMACLSCKLYGNGRIMSDWSGMSEHRYFSSDSFFNERFYSFSSSCCERTVTLKHILTTHMNAVSVCSIMCLLMF